MKVAAWCKTEGKGHDSGNESKEKQLKFTEGRLCQKSLFELNRSELKVEVIERKMDDRQRKREGRKRRKEVGKLGDTKRSERRGKSRTKAEKRRKKERK